MQWLGTTEPQRSQKSAPMKAKIDATADAQELASVLFAITIAGFQVQRMFLDERAVDPKGYAQALLTLLKPQNKA